MDIKLNELLNLTKEEIENSKIELNMTNGKNSIPKIDLWLTLTPDEKEKGDIRYSYWGWYGNKRNFIKNQNAFSFIRIKGDEWLFVSAAKILETPDESRAVVEILEKFKPFFGRLIVKYNKGNKFSRYVFKMGNIIEECTVKEILSCQYSGEKFEGYDRVHLKYGKLVDIFEGKIMPTYHEALKKITGVYCLTDTCTGKLYIGSATGSEGVFQRWGDYLSTKHGDNKKLRDLHTKMGDKYFEDNFEFSLIEHFSLSYDPQKVKDREQYWKMCFSTIKHGYNDN